MAAQGDWKEDMIAEAGAMHIAMRVSPRATSPTARPLTFVPVRQYAEFRKLLGDHARRLGAVIRTNACAVEITVQPDRAMARLESGELVVGDLLVAADGRDEVPGKRPIARELMLEVNEEEEVSKYKKVVMFK